MIRHIVLFRATDRSTAEVAQVLSALEALPQVIPGIVAITHGENRSPEGLSKGYTHAFTVDFMNNEARDAYLEDARHKSVGTSLLDLTCGLDGLCVIDLEIDEPSGGVSNRNLS